MSSIRRRRQLAIAVVLASTGLAGGGWTLPAVAETTSTLYVSGDKAVCSDSGAGTEARPFCTVQAGADAAEPGQTVLVDAAYRYTESVHITHSGEPGKPVTLKGRPAKYHPRVAIGPNDYNRNVFVLSNVHDVTLQGFVVDGTTKEAVLVADSARVVLDGDDLQGVNEFLGTPAAVSVRLTGATEDTVVSHSQLGGPFHGSSLVVEKGVTGTVVTTNNMLSGTAESIRVTDAPGTVITGNTLAGVDAPAIALNGDSAGATIENNVVSLQKRTYGNNSSVVGLSVSAGSVAGTKADYNLFSIDGGSPAYSWDGTAYREQRDFTAASAQGAHDIVGDWSQPGLMSGAIDSADASAPGESDTDLDGRPRVDDPQAPNTGGGFHDRGATELQAYSSVSVSVNINQGAFPLPVTATAKAVQNWPGSTTYSFDFGDGSAPVVTSSPTVQHVYRTEGSRPISVTATEASSHSSVTSGPDAWVFVNDPSDLVPALAITPDRRYEEGPFGYRYDFAGTTSPSHIDGYEIDFGDGSPKAAGVSGRHVYGRSGDYTVTARVFDQGGRTVTVTRQLHVAYSALGFAPITPTRVLDTRQPGSRRLGPGESVDVFVPTAASVKVRPDAAVLNVTAVNPSQGGYLSVYPAGSPRPATSNVNFTAGQVVPNLVTVPTGANGKVTVYNFSGTTDVVVDVMGSYLPGSGDRFTALAPSRLFDTRHTTALGPDATTSVQVRGVNGVPADATAAVLNLTSTDADAGGYLTAFASGTTRPGTSNLNFGVRQTVANQVVVPIGADGKVSIYNKFGHTQVVADVFGYYSPTGSSLFTPVSPTRLVDTRTAGQHALGQGGTLPVASGAPAGATGAVLNVTSTASTAGGYLTVWADGAAKPGTSNLNFLAGKTVPNHVTTPLGANGSFDVYNFLGQTQVVADLFGYFSK
ncbi:PKD domain-containing protein [Kitasatospora sp. McL0602]|uniref:PKD domain-containing protein n=1 Tax=Kitasatospora sp. McL0602 TaxID=3439530 RepID=UPI003F888654